MSTNVSPLAVSARAMTLLTVAAIALCQKALGHDPCYEAAHRRLMKCYNAQGLRHLAVRQYQICVDLLATELGLEPDPETTAMHQHIT